VSAAAASVATERDARLGDPVWRATAVAGLAQLAALAIALAWKSHAVLALPVALAGVVASAFVLGPRALAAVRRSPALVVLAALVALAVLWSVRGLVGPPGATDAPPGLDLLWMLAQGELASLVLMAAAATGGVVLIADALRVRRTRTRQAPWQQITAPPIARASVPWRAIAGVLLVGWATSVGVGVAGSYVGDSGALQVGVLVSAVAAATVVIGIPLLVGMLTRTDRDRAHDAVEDERQRFAAHLHDSVLQTLALVQRQAHDPAAVARLARRQEQSLRAWMAGETELVCDTLAAALRDVVAEVEDEESITVELTAIGDRPLDAAGEALAAAAREALRNAARHGGGAPIVVFAELTAARVEVFVRDEGAGFDPAAVAPERRGIRDAIVGRMAVAGGHATVDSAPGEGTEVALRLGDVRPAGPGR
jgi:signal transduction histidine kinase